MTSDREMRCRSVFRNLLKVRGLPESALACQYIRELEQTARCDDFYDLEEVRQSYHTLVTEDSMQRIRDYAETEQDIRRAAQAVYHYYDWTERKLVAALTWRDWFGYHTIERAERTAAMLGVGGSAMHGGWRYAARPVYLRSASRKDP